MFSNPDVNGYYSLNKLDENYMEPEDGDKVIYCDKHSNLTKIENWEETSRFDKNCSFFGNCIYCTLEGKTPYCEYDELSDVFREATSIFKIGYRDNQRGIYFLDSMVSVSIQYCYRCDVDAFRNWYTFGQEYAKKGYDSKLLDYL
jgi:hypothetical protein